MEDKHLSAIGDHFTYHSKIQTVRIIDVVFIGPVCIYAGAVKTGLPMWIRASLIGIGIATIYFNASNFIWQENIIQSIKSGKGKNNEEDKNPAGTVNSEE